MLFVAIGTLRAHSTEDSEREVLRRFDGWAPAAGVEMKALYVRADGRGPIGIFEATSAAALYESLLPFTPFINYELLPVLEVSDAVPILGRARALA